MNPDGSCPTCGKLLVADAEPEDRPKAPWHFKLLMVAVAGYLGWRLIQILGWIVT